MPNSSPRAAVLHVRLLLKYRGPNPREVAQLAAELPARRLAADIYRRSSAGILDPRRLNADLQTRTGFDIDQNTVIGVLRGYLHRRCRLYRLGDSPVLNARVAGLPDQPWPNLPWMNRALDRIEQARTVSFQRKGAHLPLPLSSSRMRGPIVPRLSVGPINPCISRERRWPDDSLETHCTLEPDVPGIPFANQVEQLQIGQILGPQPIV